MPTVTNAEEALTALGCRGVVRGTVIDPTVLMNSSGDWMTPSITKEEQLHESVKELSTSRNQDRSLSAEINGSCIFIFTA